METIKKYWWVIAGVVAYMMFGTKQKRKRRKKTAKRGYKRMRSGMRRMRRSRR
jgi:hypothetical protein